MKISSIVNNFYAQKVKPKHFGQVNENNFLRTEWREEQITYPGVSIGDMIAVGFQFGGAIMGSPSAVMIGNAIDAGDFLTTNYVVTVRYQARVNNTTTYDTYYDTNSAGYYVEAPGFRHNSRDGEPFDVVIPKTYQITTDTQYCLMAERGCF